MPNVIEQVWERFKKANIPEYALALEKREFERYLRTQGWSKKEAVAAVAKKYPKEDHRE